MAARTSAAVLARSLAGRALFKDAVHKGFSLPTVSRFGTLGKKEDLQLLKSQDEYGQALLNSQTQKRFNEHNLRIANLRNLRDRLDQKLKREVSMKKANQENYAEKLRVLGNDLLFKHMKQVLTVMAFGAVFSSLLTMNKFGSHMKESLGKVLFSTTGVTSPSEVNKGK